ncbi:hypothetical protein ABPG75_009770 [Micractinium tetrahymenae]
MEDAAGFKDFTVATAFERFVASIETCVATWAAKPGSNGLQRLQAQLQHRFPWRSEQYTLALHLPPRGESTAQREQPQQQQGQKQGQQQQPTVALAWPLANSAALRDAPDRLQQWFGVGAFLLLTPDSYSGRVLEEEEVHTLLSAAAVALSHTRITWPLLVPVHDAVRDGYRGVAVAAASAGGATLLFDTDSLHSNRLQPGLLGLPQQLLLFARQLGAAGAPCAAAACRGAAGAELDMPASMAADAAAGGTGRSFPAGSGGRHVALAVRHCYALPEPGEAEGGGSGGWAEGELRAGEGGSGEWDEHATWRPWAAQADPVGCLELDVVWRFPSAAGAVHTHALEPPHASAAAAEAGSDSLVPAEAADWRLLALSTSYERDSGHRGFVLRPVDKPRRFLRLQSLAGPAAQRILAGSAEVAPELLPSDSSFSGMLIKLADSARYAALAPDLGSLASSDWWLRQGAYQPPMAPDWVLQEATRDVLQMAVLPVWPAFPPGSVAWPTGMAGQHGCLGKAAPLGALISRLALHALALGSPRSVAELWSRFVSTLRLQYWEALQPLPRMRLGEAASAGQQQGEGHDQQKQQQQQQQQQEPRGGANAGSASGSASGGRPEAPNLELSLLHQKLQMLDLCIHLLREQQAQQGQRGQQEDGTHPQQNGSHQAAAHSGEAPDGWSWDSSDEAEEPQGDGERQPQRAAQQSQQERPRPPSPSSSTSSYFSAAGGSEASSRSALSPTCSQDHLQAQQAAEPAGGDGAEACSAGALPTAAVAAASASPAAGNGAASEAPSAATAAAGPPVLAADAPQGAVDVLPGASLHLHPDRPLRVPAVQEPPPQTEDLLAEQQVALQAYPASPGQDASALRAQLQGRMLLSDMQAFKAVNPGCCLLDFVRWHSPKDCIPAPGGSWKLSKRMAADGNAWQQLWASAAPLPAARQRPLLDPQLEGERALHFLETLPPTALFAELLAVGCSAAVQLLRAAGPAAELPAVQRQLGCLGTAARLELLHGVAAAEAPAVASAEQRGNGSSSPSAAAAAEPATAGDARDGEGAAADDAEGWEEEWDADEDQEQQQADEPPPGQPPLPAWLQPVYGSGLSSWRYRRLLLLLGCAEQAVVAAHSLLLRLGWPTEQRQLQQCISGDDSDGDSGFAAAAADKLIATALALQEQPTQDPQLAAAGPAVAPASAVDLQARHRQAAEALLVLRWAGEPAGHSGSGSEAGSAAGGWPAPFQREWLLQVHAGHAPSIGSQHDTDGTCSSILPVMQRMYVRALPSEVRIATVLSAEPCGQS